MIGQAGRRVVVTGYGTFTVYVKSTSFSTGTLAVYVSSTSFNIGT